MSRSNTLSEFGKILQKGPEKTGKFQKDDQGKSRGTGMGKELEKVWKFLKIPLTGR